MPARRPGRPRGSPNRPKPPPPAEPVLHGEIQHADPTTLIERQFVIAQWLQAAFREEIRRRMHSPNPSVGMDDVKRFEGLTVALDRAVNTLRRSSAMAEELAARMTGEQLLDAALKKVESQEPAYVRYAIKRLRLHLERIAPQVTPELPVTVIDALASLEDD